MLESRVKRGHGLQGQRKEPLSRFRPHIFPGGKCREALFAYLHVLSWRGEDALLLSRSDQRTRRQAEVRDFMTAVRDTSDDDMFVICESIAVYYLCLGTVQDHSLRSCGLLVEATTQCCGEVIKRFECRRMMVALAALQT